MNLKNYLIYAMKTFLERLAALFVERTFERKPGKGPGWPAKSMSMIFYPVKIWIFLILTGLSTVFISSCNDGHKKDLSSGEEVVLRLPPGPGNPRNSEGDFIGLKGGRILFVYTHFTSGGGDASAAHLASRISGDGGKTWSQKDEIVLPNEGVQNIMSVSLIRLESGKIALFYLRKNSDQDCIPFMRLSNDEARTWSDPVRCIPDSGYFVMNNDRVVELHGGRLLLPVALHTNDSGEFNARGRIMCYYTDDLQSWQRSAEAPNPEHVVSQEPGVVELKDGRIMLFCRTGSNAQYISYSGDRGLTWSPLEKGNIRSPMSPASIERIPATGDLLLAWNDNLQTGGDNSGMRTPFNVAVSKDEGRTWIKKKVIESNPFGWYCYTALFFTDDYVLLAHCSDDRRKTGGLQTTEINRLSLDWIYADQTADPYVVSDEKGVVELACPEAKAEILYTLDGSLPEDGHPLKYKYPIKVKKTTVLYMEARAKGKTRGNLIKTFVGKDLYQKAVELSRTAEPGLKFSCYTGKIKSARDISKLQPVKTGIAKSAGIDVCDREENFALTFNGYIRIPEDGLYVFYLSSNDGSVLYLDGTLLIDNDFPHGNIEINGTMALKAGFHKIKLGYFQQGGRKNLKLSWKGPGMEKEEIPADNFFH